MYSLFCIMIIHIFTKTRLFLTDPTVHYRLSHINSSSITCTYVCYLVALTTRITVQFEHPWCWKFGFCTVCLTAFIQQLDAAQLIHTCSINILTCSELVYCLNRYQMFSYINQLTQYPIKKSVDFKQQKPVICTNNKTHWQSLKYHRNKHNDTPAQPVRQTLSHNIQQLQYLKTFENWNFCEFGGFKTPIKIIIILEK